MAKIFNKFFNILLILIIIVLVIFLVLKSLNIVYIFNVETGSMEDKIHAGDYVLLYKTNNYSVGDIITYQVDNYFVTHRVVKIENNKIQTRGDANNTNDEEININQIKGKIIYYGGLLNIIIKFKFTIAAFFIGLYLLNSYYFNNKNKNKSEEKDENQVKEK